MEFELDLIIFKKVSNYLKTRKARKSKDELSKTIDLVDISSRLTFIARALTGRNIDILPAEEEGGWKDQVFYLPASFSKLPTFEENLNFYIFRVVYLCIQSEKNLNWFNTAGLQSLENSRIEAEHVAPHVLQNMEEEYPPTFAFFQSIEQYLTDDILPSYWLYGKYMIAKDVIEGNAADANADQATNNSENNPSTVIKSKPVEEVEVITVDKKAQEEYLLLHNFEKVETAEEFSGLWRGFDGDDSLEEDMDALNELNLKHLVRTDEQAQSIYQADFRNLVNIADSTSTEDKIPCLTYNEWDHAHRKYKLNHCKVYRKTLTKGTLDYANNCLAGSAKTLHALRRKFSQIHQQRQIVKKLQDGEGIDMDALVDWYTDIQSGHNPNDNIYFSKRKRDADLAILFLLDTSLSTDSYVNGLRVLDVEKQAAVLFGEVLSEYSVDFAISGFYSKTRNHCVYHSIKDFGEAWTAGKQRISQIEPTGYTRIGPALRHSKTLISEHPARQKWVILLSDGKPNDYDKYEGKYGIADVKQALREMHEHHINTYAIAIESTARYYLPQMFGQNHYNILSNPAMLIPSLTTLYRRINNG